MADLIFVRIPAGWRVVDIDALLGEEVAGLFLQALGDIPEVSAVRVWLAEIRAVAARDRLIFMAIRAESGACDVVTLGLPAPDERYPERMEEPGAPVLVGDVRVVVHEDGQKDGDVIEAWPVVEQIVLFVSGTRNGAVLTALSTDPLHARRLKRDVREIAKSLSSRPIDAGVAQA